ncbi:MAG TPA: SEC-C metal-binding domain-containing protein, partial [Gemmatimonadaceae bacterium]
KRLHGLGFPVLIGTTSVDASETLSKMFSRAGLVHNVLNAKHHQREAEIVAEAGQPGAVTIATNMAGRGTDIKLGPGVTEPLPSKVKDPDGNEINVMELGGLHIVGSERHESRRIDRQLRGRAGRQGDPGASQFFLSLEDDLMRLFGSDRIARIMDRMGAQEGEVLTHSLITRSIEQAQKRVELQNFQARKRLLEYDDVMNQQREVIYSLRSFALEGGEELKGEAQKMIERAMSSRVERELGAVDPDAGEAWDFELLQKQLLIHYMLRVPEIDDVEKRPTDLAGLQRVTIDTAQKAFTDKLVSLDAYKDEAGVGYGNRLLSLVMLQVLDEKWKDHLYDLDQLRNAIHYRSWGQKDPLIEYKQEAYTMFVDLMSDIYGTFTEAFLKAQLRFDEQAPAAPPPPPPKPTKRFGATGILEDIPDEGAPKGAVDVGPGEPLARTPVARPDPTIVGAGKVKSFDGDNSGPVDWSTVGRNDPCPCGSGKKFKKCHGANL